MPALELPAETTSIARARKFVDEHALGHVADRDAVLVMTSELVTNVVRHGSGMITVRVESGPPCRVEIHDGAAATEAFRALIANRRPPVPSTSPGGRGIWIVQSLASKVGLDDDEAGGKVVWFEV